MTSWKNLGFKEKYGFIGSGISFVVGTILIFAGLFLPPVGVIDSSVITATGEFLALTALLSGFTSYIHTVSQEVEFRLGKLEAKSEESEN